MLLAIDPGPTESAYLVFVGTCVQTFGKVPNDDLVAHLPGLLASGIADHVAIEMVESFGMPVGREVFGTVFWAGRFAQAALPWHHTLVPRSAVKMHLCGSKRAKDANIRAALIDRFGGSAAIGKKAHPGPLYGISGDVWQALAVAVTWHDTHEEAA